MPVRQYHRKTRAGCAQCKARRTKCDERKPRCEKCVKRNERCSFNDSSIVIIQSLPSAGLGSAEKPQSRIPAGLGSPGNMQLQTRSRSGEGNWSRRTCLWLDAIPQKHDQGGTLSLMHHCALFSSISIADRRKSLTAWRHLVTQLVFKNDFLLHAILSVTSIHVALLHPSALLTRAAIQHHSIAVKLVLPHLAAVTQENAAALCVFSRVVPICARGLAKILPSDDPIAQICEDCKLVRGMAVIGEKASKWVDPFLSNELVLPQFSNSCASLPKETEDSLAMLSTRNHESTCDFQLRESIDAAVALLRYSFQLLQERPNDVSIRAPFVMFVPQRFIEALETREPMALAVLSHFALVTHSLRGTLWMQELGKEVIEAVAKVLPSDWQDCIKWPLSQV